MKCSAVISLLLSSLLTGTRAHRPATTKPSCGNDFASSDTALKLLDPTISWAFQHFVDCSNRATWIEFDNSAADSMFYVGVLVPDNERFADVRADALIIGPGLPSLTDEEMALVPEDVKASPVWNIESVGAILHRGQEDQSTCSHLGTVMTQASTVRNGRCDFYERFGDSHSWPILDADNNAIPIAGETYYVAVWLQEDTSSKISIALGTWVENFRTPFDVAVPTCARNLADFHEKESMAADTLPFVFCDNVTDIAIGGNSIDTCPAGEVCDGEIGCVVDGKIYQTPSMVCGGKKCPAATRMWEEVNMKMMEGMMDIKYSGDADIDFVRGMIPHHEAAMEMCNILLNDLTCTEISDIDNLDGLVHLCSHIAIEQDIEVGGMRRWLESNNVAEKATCPDAISRQSMTMMESCGEINYPSAVGLIEANHKMHSAMAVDISCDHAVDFVRGMLPHHEGAIAMCDVLMTTTSDDYLIELCGNITLTQYAEIAWMREWLDNRGKDWLAPCADDCDTAEVDNELPCEDLLSTSSFCHALGQDAYCRCNDVVGKIAECGITTYVPGVGPLDVNGLCARSCGICPDRKPIFHYTCDDGHGGHGNHGGHGGHGNHGGHGGHDNHEGHGGHDNHGGHGGHGDDGDHDDHNDGMDMGSGGSGIETDTGTKEEDSSAFSRSTIDGLFALLLLVVL